MLNRFLIFLGEKFLEIEQEINNQKDLVFNEIYAYYIAKFGYGEGGVKFSNLFGLLHETMVQ